jgi:hypothetical protein
VATSRDAAWTYFGKLEQTRLELVRELKDLPAKTISLPEGEVEKLDSNTRFLVRAHRYLPMLRALEIAPVFSAYQMTRKNEDYTDKAKQEERISVLNASSLSKSTADPLAILVVMNML